MKTLFYPILKTKEGIKMKRVLLLLFVLLLAACGRTTTPIERSQTTQTSVIHETTMETSTNQTSSETNATSETQEPIPVETQANLVGTWVQENLTLTIDQEGHWQLTGGITSQGTLKVAVDNGAIKMVKLYGFNVNIDSIGNYFIAKDKQNMS
jgi:predicted aspartyl protease